MTTGTNLVKERIRHCSEFPEELVNLIKNSDFKPIAEDADSKKPVLLKLKGHPFYVASIFHPEYVSKPGFPHYLFEELIKMSSVKR